MLELPYKSYRSFTQARCLSILCDTCLGSGFFKSTACKAPAGMGYNLHDSKPAGVANGGLIVMHAMQDACRKVPLINDFGFPDSYFMQLEP